MIEIGSQEMVRIEYTEEKGYRKIEYRTDTQSTQDSRRPSNRKQPT